MTTVLAVYSDAGCLCSCDASCHNARHHICLCICGGANHGKGREAAMANNEAHLTPEALERFAAAHGLDASKLTVYDALRTPTDEIRRLRKMPPPKAPVPAPGLGAIRVTQEGNRWIARFPFSYETKDLVKAAGFRFDGANKYWWTNDAEVAARLTEAKDPADIVAAAEQARIAREKAEEAARTASRATASTLDIPRSAVVQHRGWDFFPYQKAGVEFALARPATLIADEMGLGKTMQAIGVINADASINNVLIICPASLKLNWARECNLWLARKMPVALANGKLPKSGVCIINYEQVLKLRSWIDSVQWDLLVADEAHYLKNPKAKRTHAVLGFYDKEDSKIVHPIAAKRKIFLTGTPILNRPKELWTLVHALDRQGLGKSWKGFHVRYCAGFKGDWGWQIDGHSHLDELQAKLRSTIMVRRLKSEVLLELPAKQRQVVAFQPQSAEEFAAIAAESEQVFKSEKRLKELQDKVDGIDKKLDKLGYDEAVKQLNQARMVEFTETSRVRHQVAVAKVGQVVSHITDVLEGSERKLVVFAHHHDVADKIASELAAYGVLQADGRNTTAERDAAVQRFQNAPESRVIVCGIAAMGVGHTLTASAHVIFAELDWSPANLQQAEDRCHRIGQRNSVLVQHLVLDGSMDGRMAETIVDKMGVISAAVD